MDGAALVIVLNKLNDILEKQVPGAEEEKEIRSLHDELALLTIFLKGLEEMSYRNALVDDLVSQLNQVSYRTEDLVDRYFSNVAGFKDIGVVIKFLTMPFKKLEMKHELALESEKVKKQIHEILEKKDTYGIRLDESHQRRLREQTREDDLDRRRRIIEEDDVVGFDQQTDEVIRMLIPEGGLEEDDEELRVISIVGIAGIGKTTLAKKVFNSHNVNDHFPVRVWLVVSQNYEINNLLKSILKHLSTEHEDESSSLRDALHKQLNRGRYLIVLDDVWSSELWDELGSCLPSNQKNGSRILMTSKTQNVISSAISTMLKVYHLDPLGENESWILFCKKAFKSEECPSNLEEVGKCIVSKCKGIPLAIVVMGSFLCASETTPSHRYWSKILNDKSWHPNKDYDCSKILSLTYNILQQNLKPSTQGSSGQQKREDVLDRRRRNVEEDDVVGFDQQADEVIRMLIPEQSQLDVLMNEKMRVVSIIGMGGLGKTTLAKKIVNSEESRSRFWVTVWVTVSQHGEVKHVLKNILLSLDFGAQQEDEEMLKKEVRQLLKGKRYQLVLDDVWSPELWEALRSCLPPDESNGSRILLTSRNQSVGNAASTEASTYLLQPLGVDDSWLLFCKKALKGEACPSHLEDTGKGIALKCKGLPLAIVVMGSLLSAAETFPSFRYWSEVLDDISWHPDEDNDCSKILSLSYQNLPYHLKLCFLYVGIFPEDFEILAKQLCLLWMAEGFVEAKRGRLAEDVAEQYLFELVDRNLLDVSKKRSDGGIKICRIHDLLRDLCIVEAERYKLYKVEMIGTLPNITDRTRSITVSTDHKVRSVRRPLHTPLRSFLDFGHINCRSLDSFCKEPYMRIVHTEDVLEHRSFKIVLSEKSLLRYLRLRCIWPKIDELMYLPSISKVRNLQFLDLSDGGRGCTLPSGIWKLGHLRYIGVRLFANMPDPSLSDDALLQLQVFLVLKIEKHTSNLISGGKFPNLKKLSIFYNGDHSEEPWLNESLESLHKLQHLVAVNIEITGAVTWRGTFPATLTKITLQASSMSLQTWELLGELKNLLVLKLIYIGQCPQLTCKSEAFPQLYSFKIRAAIMLDMKLEDGALQALRYLIMLECRLLTELPEKLWLFPNLRQIKLTSPSEELKNHIMGLDEHKRSKIFYAL